MAVQVESYGGDKAMLVQVEDCSGKLLVILYELKKGPFDHGW